MSITYAEHRARPYTPPVPTEIDGIRALIETNQFVSIFEPKMPITSDGNPIPQWYSSTGLTTDVELLSRLEARLPSGARKLLMPKDFIPQIQSEEALETGVASAFAIHCLQDGHDLAKRSGLRVWVNIDPRLLGKPDFRHALHETDLDGVGFEILETHQLGVDTRTKPTMQWLQRIGVPFSIDDYYPSGYLQSKPKECNAHWNIHALEANLDGVCPDEIKIAGEVSLFTPDQGEYAELMTDAIAEVASLGPKTITFEAVTNSGQAGVLAELMSGYPHVNGKIQSYTFNPGGPRHMMNDIEIVNRYGNVV